MKKLLLLTLLLGFLFGGCWKQPDNQLTANKPPTTYLSLFPDSTLAEGNSQQRLHWWGDDPDGMIKAYLFSFDTLALYDSTGFLLHPNDMRWRYRIGNDTLIAFPLQQRRETFFVAVRSIDNTFKLSLPDQALIRVTPTRIFWDKNENDTLDADDVTFTFPTNSVDPKGATLAMPVLNQPPTLSFAPNPYNPFVTMQQPETTYTAATFAWIGSDPDGDNTIAQYRIALNDPSVDSNWVSLSKSTVNNPGEEFGLTGTIGMITLFVPRSRSDSSITNIVDADIYSHKFYTRQKIGTVRGLKLDSLNTFYIQAIDIAGDTSKPTLQMPGTGKYWFVKKPKSRLLTVVDYLNPSDSSNASEVYHTALAQVMLPTGSLANYDELNIARGITFQNKIDAAAGSTSSKFGALVPAFINPALIYTFYLFDYIFWYTDVYPLTPVAQATLFPYIGTEFNGHKGKVIYSTSFLMNPDPRGLIRDFAPIDSVSSVVLDNSRLFPSLGDFQIPKGYEILAGPSNSSYPKLKVLNPRDPSIPLLSIYLRPVYKRSDASYIYYIQEDSTSSTRTYKHYAYALTLSDFKSSSLVGSSLTLCGGSGMIYNSIDNGVSWTKEESGTSFSLNGIDFLTSTKGITVGDTGTVVITNDGGMSWTNKSLPTFQNLLAVHFPVETLAVTVGTSGILLRSTDGGNSWTSRTSTTRKTLRSVQFRDGAVGIAVGDSTVIKSVDGGFTWQAIGSIPQRRYNDVYWKDESNVFVVSSPQYVGGASLILHSTDAGEAWSQTSISNADLLSIRFISASAGWITGKNGAIYTTTDGGTNWSRVMSGVTQHLNTQAFLNENTGWAMGTGGLILRTIDGGVNWVTQPTGQLNVGVIDGTKSFVFLGLPLHMLNYDGDNVKRLFEHILLQEFAQ